MNSNTILWKIGFLFLIISWSCLVSDAQAIRTIDWNDFPTTGDVSQSDMITYGGFDYATRGFGNGPESNYNDAFNLSIEDDPFGAGSGRWARILSRTWPGENTVHTFGKSVRGVNLGNSNPFSYDEIWIDVPLYIPEEWITHDQGKLGYSLTNPDGTAPGTNPTEAFELLFHYFSPNNFKTNKPEAPWYSENPVGPFEEQDMLIGLDAYCADERVNTNYSEPIFFREELNSITRKVFEKETHYILRAHIKLNTPNVSDGILETWYSEDGGTTWIKSIEVLDFDWRGTQSDNFEQEGFVAFRGGSGHGFEVGGNDAVSKNTGVYNEPQDTWYYLGNIDVYDMDPFETVLDFNVFNLKSNDVKSGVRISWDIMEVVENYDIELEKAYDGNDWTLIHSTKHISSPNLKSYDFLDLNPKPGLNYYRLKKTSVHGEHEYSNVIVFIMKAEYDNFKIFPNPADQHVQISNVESNALNNAKVVIKSMDGRTIEIVDLKKDVIIDLSFLQEGTYMMSVVLNGVNIETEKLKVFR